MWPTILNDMKYNICEKTQVKREGIILLFFGIAAITVVPVSAADLMVMAKEAIAPSAEAGVKNPSLEIPEVVQNAEEDEFSGFNDFFQSALPEKEEGASTQTGNVATGQEDANVTLPAMTVSGIVWGTIQPRAIINGDIYEEGDIVKDAEAQVKRINEEGILFMYKDKEFLMKRSQLDRLDSRGGT